MASPSGKHEGSMGRCRNRAACREAGDGKEQERRSTLPAGHVVNKRGRTGEGGQRATETAGALSLGHGQGALTATEMRARSAQATSAGPGPPLLLELCCCCGWKLACCLLLDLICGRHIEQASCCCCDTSDRCAARELSNQRPVKFATAATPIRSRRDCHTFCTAASRPGCTLPSLSSIQTSPPSIALHPRHPPKTRSLSRTTHTVTRPHRLRTPVAEPTAPPPVSTASPSANEYMLRRSFEHPP